MPGDDAGPDVGTVDVVARRVFDTPVAEVWKAWSDSAWVRRWWGPKGFTSPLAAMDFRVGGTSLVCMRSPETGDLYNTWRYVRIEPMQRIEFVLNFADKDGVALDPAALGISDVPTDVRHVITLRALGAARTELTVTEYGYRSGQAAELSKVGLEECLDKMGAIFGPGPGDSKGAGSTDEPLTGRSVPARSAERPAHTKGADRE
jgi:uncharacterized protein YndB with AHSA1/START domain